jgi:sec-independent protein translocase protein TatA
MIGSIGLPELILILFVALIVLGPKRLPEVGRSLGDAVRGFRRAFTEPDEPRLDETKRIKKDND